MFRMNKDVNHKQSKKDILVLVGGFSEVIHDRIEISL